MHFDDFCSRQVEIKKPGWETLVYIKLYKRKVNITIEK